MCVFAWDRKLVQNVKVVPGAFLVEMGIEPNRKGSSSVRFDRHDSSVRVRFDLIL